MNNKNFNIFLILGISFITLLTSVFSVGAASRTRSKDVRISADMNQMRSAAQIIESNEDSYLSVNCEGNKDISSLCDDIEKQTGIKPVIHSSEKAYCAYTVLLDQQGYYCINSDLLAIKTYIPPGEEGYCNGITFSCPTETGIAPPENFSSNDLFPWIILIGGGILVLIFYGFLWRQAFKRRKEEMGREESWSLIKEEIKSKKVFYISLSLLLFSIASPFFFFLCIIILDYWESPEWPINLSILIGSVTAIVLIVSTPRLIKGALKNRTEMVCWEAYAACFCLGSAFFILIAGILIAGTFASVVLFIAFCIFPILTFGFTVSTLIHRGKLNRIIGLTILPVYLCIMFLGF